jgi:hypothetical protein
VARQELETGALPRLELPGPAVEAQLLLDLEERVVGGVQRMLLVTCARGHDRDLPDEARTPEPFARTSAS